MIVLGKKDYFYLLSVSQNYIIVSDPVWFPSGINMMLHACKISVMHQHKRCK